MHTRPWTKAEGARQARKALLQFRIAVAVVSGPADADVLDAVEEIERTVDGSMKILRLPF
jgi:hypothetical protein